MLWCVLERLVGSAVDACAHAALAGPYAGRDHPRHTRPDHRHQPRPTTRTDPPPTVATTAIPFAGGINGPVSPAATGALVQG